MRGRVKLFSMAFILIVFSLHLPCIKGNGGYIDVTVSEARDMIVSNPLLAILDVRTQGEYDSGHIRNTKLIPHTELEARIDELDENRETLVYCRSGGRSVTASRILIDHGFTQVYNMLGGILAWTSKGYPIYVRYTSLQEAINSASDRDTMFVSSGTYLEHLIVNRSLTITGENRNTTIIDGGGTGNVVLVKENNITISDFTIRGSGCGCAAKSGIHLQNSHNSSIKTNIITDNGYGIQLQDSKDSTISGNTVYNNDWPGIALNSSHRNIIASNDIRENHGGIRLSNSSDNMFYHNSIVDNTYQAIVKDAAYNLWDDGYSSGGNYWSDYTGVDLRKGPYQNETGSDGVGDTQYTIDENNQDSFPLMNPYIPPEELRVLYYKLLEKYNSLLVNCQSLNSTYYTLMSNYSELQGDFNSLLTSHNNLQGYYDALNSTYDELKSKQEATINELNNMKTLTYILITTTIVLVATTVYFGGRRPQS